MSLAMVKNSLSCFHKEMLKIGSSKLKKKKKSTKVDLYGI